MTNADAALALPIIATSIAVLIHEAITQRRDRRAARVQRVREVETARTIAHIRRLPLADAIAAETARRELDDDLRGMGS